MFNNAWSHPRCQILLRPRGPAEKTKESGKRTQENAPSRWRSCVRLTRASGWASSRLDFGIVTGSSAMVMPMGIDTRLDIDSKLQGNGERR